ncbi:MAG: hypothetical protein GEV10_07860 [Streptosporangiales bacterium]|nr:hypothetical protein [Streptosporangiales bacterium]
MDTLRNPSGPLPASTYWRRRLVIIGVLLAVVAGVVWACANNSGAEQKPTGAAGTPTDIPTVPADTVSPTPTPTPTGTGTTGTGEPTGTATTGTTSAKASPSLSTRNGKLLCPASDLRVSVRSDQKFYSAGQQPKFTLIVVNLRKKPCYVDVGSSALGVTVISGKDRVWSTVDCAKSPAEKLRRFESGDVYTATASWKKTRSAKGCPATKGTAKPGYYVLDGHVGKVKPEERSVFVLEKG